MKLFEVEGKQILKKYGISTPDGWLVEELPGDVQFPLIGKVQVLSGGRGKAGGVKIIPRKDVLESVTSPLYELIVNGEQVREVYLEKPVDYEKEIYLSLLMDRTRKSPVIIASQEGGVDIEETPAEKVLVIPINPLIGLQPYMVHKLSFFLKLEHNKVTQLVNGLWKMFVEEQAELVEINPLFADRNGELIAGDAKIVLSGNAAPDQLLFDRDTDSFEASCEKLQVGCVSMGGDISIVASGAGLGMATLDIITHEGGSVHSLIDLQGHIIHQSEESKLLIREILKQTPKSFFFNFYFQVASCRVLSEAIASELGGKDIPVIVRMKGNDLQEARDLLAQYPNIKVTENLQDACDSMLQLAKETV